MPTPAQTGITWGTISAAIGIVLGVIGITRFILEPLEARLEAARSNYIRSIAERDARMDYLQRQIDDLERKLMQ